MTRNLQILLFNDAEVLDFSGPFEVFTSANDAAGESLFDVRFVAEDTEPVRARNDFRVLPHYSLEDASTPDILLVPGGNGSREALRNRDILDWIRAKAGEVELLLSVCTGALVLGEAGLLDGLRATTYHNAFDALQKHAPGATMVRNQKYVDNGDVILSAGVSAGIDMSFHVIEKLFDRDLAERTAQKIEYDWQPDPSID